MLGGNPWAQMIVQQQQQQIAAVQAQAQAAHAQAAAIHANAHNMHVAQQMAMQQMSSAPPHRIPEPLSEEKLQEKCECDTFN